MNVVRRRTIYPSDSSSNKQHDYVEINNDEEARRAGGFKKET